MEAEVEVGLPVIAAYGRAGLGLIDSGQTPTGIGLSKPDLVRLGLN